MQSEASGGAAAALAAFDKQIEALAGAPSGGGRGRGQGPGAGGRGGAPGAAAPESLRSAAAALAGVMTSLQDADVQPTTMQLNAIASARAIAARVMARWTRLRTTELAALNATLKSAGMTAIVALDSSSPPK